MPPPGSIQGRFAGQDMHKRFCARLASRTYDCVHRHAARAAVTHEACNFAKTQAYSRKAICLCLVPGVVCDTATRRNATRRGQATLREYTT